MLNITLDITDANKIVAFVIIKNYINITCFQTSFISRLNIK